MWNSHKLIFKYWLKWKHWRLLFIFLKLIIESLNLSSFKLHFCFYWI
jgi:hypothetical protein